MIKNALTTVFVIALVISFRSWSFSDECTKVTIHYNERPPYQITSGNQVTGITIDPIAKAFQKTGIPFQWTVTPSKRQMVLFEANIGCDCGVGWFKNPDREKFALFTTVIYKDKPQVAIVRSNDMRLKNGTTIDAAFANKELHLLVKDGYSYGASLDEKIAKGNPPLIKTTVENVNMIYMLKNERADYYILAPEEAESLVTSAGLKMNEFRLVSFSDMPPGNERYLMCSKNVGENIIKKISAALSEIVHVSE